MVKKSMLTEPERILIQRTIDKVRREDLGTSGRPAVGPDIKQTPDIILARTPSGGIPPLIVGSDVGTFNDGLDDTPGGQAGCQLYQISAGALKLMDLPPQYVWNMSSDGIPGNVWVYVARDKFGEWHVLSVATPSTSGVVTNYKNRCTWTSDSEVEGTGGVSGALQPPGNPVGNWPTTMTAVPNIVYALPIVIGNSPQASFSLGGGLLNLAVHLQTAGSTGAECRIALYKNDSINAGVGGWLLAPGSQTGDLLFECAITLDSTALEVFPGYEYGGPEGDPDIPLDPGVYWLCIVFKEVDTMPVVGACSTDRMLSLYGASDVEFPVEFMDSWNVPFGMTLQNGVAQASYTYGPFSTNLTWVGYGVSPIVGTQTVPMPLMNY